MAWRFDLGNRLGECVLWDARTQTAYWTDIEAKAFWRWPFGALSPMSVPVADRLASFGLTAEPELFVGAFAKEFALFAPWADRHVRIAPVEPDDCGTMMNDGRTDRSGNFWASSKMVDPASAKPRAKLWRSGAKDAPSPFLGQMQVPNGLAWSIDGSIMFLSDSETGVIWRFAFDSVLGPSRPSVFAIVEEGKPDGACVDAEDCLWVAHWGAGRIICYHPDGSIRHRIDLPARHPTCVAFGGPDLDQLLVTSERPDDTATPADGTLLVYRTPYVGIAEARSTAVTG